MPRRVRRPLRGGWADVLGEVGSSGTSCPFAEAVRTAYAASGPVSTAPRQIYAASPVTKQQYALTCAASGSLVVCNGGSDAVVYLY